MSKSTPVPVASTYEEAYPNSTKVYDEQVVESPAGQTKLRESWVAPRRVRAR